jgi:hypothetical protein
VPAAQRGGWRTIQRTHDPAVIEATRRFAREYGIDPVRYEFQMLCGVYRDLQTARTRERIPCARLRSIRA